MEDYEKHWSDFRRAKRAVRRGIERRIFSALGAQWRATISRDGLGDLVHIFIHPELEENEECPAVLRGAYSNAAALCQTVNALLERVSARAIADVLEGVCAVTNGHRVANIQAGYRPFFGPICTILKESGRG